jgi:hypothetical protein
MTDRETPEIPVSPQATANLEAAVLELRSQNGFLVDMRSLMVHDIPGVEYVCVGEYNNGQFVLVTSESEAEGPFMRDIFVLDGGRPRQYRLTVELDETEAEVVRRFKDKVSSWQELLVTFDEDTQVEQIQRFELDSKSFSESLDAYKDIGNLEYHGDISGEEAEQRRSQVPLSYDVYDSEDPAVAEYELRYAACVRATLDYQALTLGIDNKLDIATSDVIEPEGSEVPAEELPVTEAKAWNLIGILDRVTVLANAA